MATQTIEQTAAQTASDVSSVRAVLHGAGGGAWAREASLALALAAQSGVRLDEETLIYSDVRDLMALQQKLRAAGQRSGR